MPDSLRTGPSITTLALSGQTGCLTAATTELSDWLNSLDPNWNNGCPICSTQTSIPEPECAALVELYDSTAGASWTDNTGWLTDPDPCTWYGVTCAAGHVDTLDLDGNQLAGSIPTQLGNLTALTDLYLFSNQLTGSIPTQLGNLTALTHLYLFNNQLTGSIPTQLENLTALTHLYLSDNQLTGSIPTQLENLTALRWLYLNNNQLTGSIPTTETHEHVPEQQSVDRSIPPNSRT